MRWLYALWLVSAMLFLFFSLGLSLGPQATIVIQAAIVIVGGMFVAVGKKRSAIPPLTNRRRLILVITAAAMMLMAIFPPVRAVAAEPGSEPLFMFFLDSRFDSSRQVPLYAINFGQLLVRWAVIATVAAVGCFRIGRHART